jgi:hypothetical protein
MLRMNDMEGWQIRSVNNELIVTSLQINLMRNLC